MVGLINDIASQTNLLALMRPSRQRGRGRPAGGLQWLHPRSSRWPARPQMSPRDIRTNRGGSEGALEAVEAIKGIGGIISEVDGVASAIAAAVEQQGAATQEIAR